MFASAGAAHPLLGRQRRAAEHQQREQQRQRRRRRRRFGRQLRERERERALRQQRDAGADRQHAEPEPDPVDERVDDDLQASPVCVAEVARLEREHDVEILGERAPDRDFGRRLVLVLAEEPLRRVQRVDLLAVLEHRDVRRDHLLLAVVGAP